MVKVLLLTIELFLAKCSKLFYENASYQRMCFSETGFGMYHRLEKS